QCRCDPPHRQPCPTRRSSDLRLVDLPDYGYAKVSKEQQQTWQQHLNRYLEQRQSLQGLVLVMDIRNPMTEFDQMMLNWAEASELDRKSTRLYSSHVQTSYACF